MFIEKCSGGSLHGIVWSIKTGKVIALQNGIQWVGGHEG